MIKVSGPATAPLELTAPAAAYRSEHQDHRLRRQVEPLSGSVARRIERMNLDEYRKPPQCSEV